MKSTPKGNKVVVANSGANRQQSLKEKLGDKAEEYNLTKGF